MNVFEMIVVIVFISVIGGVISKSIKASYQQKSRKENEADNNITEKHLAELEKRIIVLEQIVTSEGYDLNQKFKDIDNK